MSDKNKNKLERQSRLNTIKKTPKVFTTEQLIELIELSKTGPNGMRNHCMIVLLATTGLRVGELRNLQISDYDSEKQIIRVREKKNKIRQIPISTSLGDIIKTYIELTFGVKKNEHKELEFQELYLFPSRNGNTPVTSRLIHCLTANLIEKAKTIPEDEKNIAGDIYQKKQAYGPSNFRNTFILNLLQEEQPVITISYLTGITSTSTLKYYLENMNIE